MKNIIYISISLLFLLIACKKVINVDTYQVWLGEVNIVTKTDDVSINAQYTYGYVLKSVKLLYSDNESLSNAITKETQFVNGILTVTVSGLKPSTTYFYKFEFDNGITKMWSDVGSFMTLKELVVRTADVTDIVDTSVVCGGEVISNGNSAVIARGVCYSLSENPTIENCIDTTFNGCGLGKFTSHITGLMKDTTYYVRAYATNSEKTSYGGQKDIFIKTVADNPTIFTSNLSNITATTANSGGYDISDGGSPIIQKGVCWGCSDKTTLGNCIGHTNDGIEADDFSSTITGLTESTIYYARAYAKNKLKTGYGEPIWFLTEDEIPGNYFCIAACDAGTTTVSLATEGSIPPVHLVYKINHDGLWTKFSITNTTIRLSKNDSVFFKALVGEPNYTFALNYTNYHYFVIQGGEVNISGNIMYLLDPKGNIMTFPSHSYDYAFSHLFFNCNKIINAGQLILPATTLTDYCYEDMFSGCTSLKETPELPATNLAVACYFNMFGGCTSLTEAPELPATTLTTNCYYNMFNECVSLTKAPELPATTLSNNCYDRMFYGCSSLTKAPDLPATTLTNNCYSNMFYKCTSLTKSPELPATTLVESCYSCMFSVCTSLTKAPDLPATTMANYCYNSMFSGCTSLAKAPDLPATSLAVACYYNMFDGCTSLTEAPELPATTLEKRCYHSMFCDCTSLTEAPDLPATTLVDYCYNSMFSGCTNLHKIKMLANKKLNATYALYSWVVGVGPTGDFYKKADANLPHGNDGIPSGWTVHE